MIKRSELTPVGTFGKPHGINGEISALWDSDADPAEVRCIVLDTDGIYVPFFINSTRPKSTDSILLTIDGITDEHTAKSLTNKTIFALTEDIDALLPPSEDDEEGFYAADLIGFYIYTTDGHPIGKICDIEDRTENVLFIVARPDGSTAYIPVADEYIAGIDTDKSRLVMDLPDGLIDL